MNCLVRREPLLLLPFVAFIDDDRYLNYTVIIQKLNSFERDLVFDMKGNKKFRLKTILLIAVVILTIAVSTIIILDYIIEKDGTWKPDYSKIDLEDILRKKSLSQQDYDVLFQQTGLGQPAVESLRKDYDEESELVALFKEYQDNFFSSVIVECRKIGLITFEEKVKDEEERYIKAFQIANIRKGDVIISKSTHSIGWRHGHAAIVINEEKGETLEAILWGHDSVPQSIEKWRRYPSFILLRLKNDENNKAAEIADYALQHLNEIPYGLFTGIPNKAPEPIVKTQCSHLVWYPYYKFGYDIDSDGSWLVTPKDIANSDLFEVVQVYGINPEQIWK